MTFHLLIITISGKIYTYIQQTNTLSINIASPADSILGRCLNFLPLFSYCPSLIHNQTTLYLLYIGRMFYFLESSNIVPASLFLLYCSSVREQARSFFVSAETHIQRRKHIFTKTLIVWVDVAVTFQDSHP